MVTLGLDLSTTTVGYCFCDQTNRTIIYAGFVDISKADNYKDKIKLITDAIESHNIKFDTINLEAALSGFGFGGSSTQVIIKLMRFNAVCEYVLSEHFNIKINLVGATTARKQLFGKARLKGIKSKDYVKQQINAMFNMTQWEIINKVGNVDKRIEDTRDAVVIAFYK